MLHDLLVALLLFGVVAVVLCVAVMAYARWRVRKQLRLRLGTPSAAPTGWLVSTSEPARLHRRLRRATNVARVAGGRGGPALAEMAAEIEDHAIALEAHLVLLSRVWRRERSARHQLSAQVAQLEMLSLRLSRSAADAQRPPALGAGSPDALAELAERVDALDAARAELVALEQHFTPR